MAGVCSGLAVHLGLPVSLVRVMFICLAAFGVGIGVYLWLWVTVPDDSPEKNGAGTLSPGLVRLREERAAQVSRNRMIVVGVALVVAAIVGTVLNATGTLDWRDMGAIVSIISGIALVWSQSRDVNGWRSLRFVGIVAAGLLLLSLGVVMVASRDNPPVILLRGGLIGAALVAGVLFALVPMWLRTTKDLSQAQAQRVREAERADIAAHLHDSVLQALTLIRASAEDPARVRAELENSGADLEVVGDASDVEGAIAACRALTPDVALLDVHLPGGNGGGGAEVASTCRDIEGLHFLALSVSDAAEDVVQVIRAGARGYVTKSISTPDLVEAIGRVAAGDAAFSPRLAGFVLDAFGTGEVSTTDTELDLLSAREQEVMRLIARGYTYKEVAHDLFISIKTVETHVSAVLRKLQLSNRNELTRWAMQRHIV